MIAVDCPQCGRSMNAPDDAGGKRARCKGCGRAVSIPHPAAATTTPTAVTTDDPPAEMTPFERAALDRLRRIDLGTDYIAVRLRVLVWLAGILVALTILGWLPSGRR